MKALQDRCVANEGVIRRFCKHQEIENKERDQYKEAVHTLNTELTAKLALLKEETCRREEEEKVKTNLMTELAAFREQMDKAKADTVAAFRVSQPIFDKYGTFYGNRFDDLLKQVKANYLDLDLSWIAIDDTVLPTLRGNGVVSVEIENSVHTVE